jgi:hypothetical protein
MSYKGDEMNNSELEGARWYQRDGVWLLKNKSGAFARIQMRNNVYYWGLIGNQLSMWRPTLQGAKEDARQAAYRRLDMGE